MLSKSEHCSPGTPWSAVLTFVAIGKVPVSAMTLVAFGIKSLLDFLAVSKPFAVICASDNEHEHHHIELNQIDWLVESVAMWIGFTSLKPDFMCHLISV